MNFNTQSKTRQCLQPNVFLLHRSDMGETTGGPRFVIRSILRALTLPGCSSSILESYFTGNIIKHMYVCIYNIYIYIWINRVRLPILLVVSRTGEIKISLSPFAPDKLVSRDEFVRPVLRQPVHSPHLG